MLDIFKILDPHRVHYSYHQTTEILHETSHASESVHFAGKMISSSPKWGGTTLPHWLNPGLNCNSPEASLYIAVTYFLLCKLNYGYQS